MIRQHFIFKKSLSKIKFERFYFDRTIWFQYLVYVKIFEGKFVAKLFLAHISPNCVFYISSMIG
jgi:hypothetical protein